MTLMKYKVNLLLPWSAHFITVNARRSTTAFELADA